MSAFKKYGITHLSPSALNCWRETPGLWCLRYLAGVRDAGNAAMWRGTATERGVELILRGSALGDAEAMALAEYRKLSVGELTDEIEAEGALIAPMVRQSQAWKTRANLEPLAATQLKVETWLEGVTVPVIGYVDFTFMGGPDIDLKTTKRCPSEPNPNHLRQVALYNRARMRPAALLYVTDKKSAFYQPMQDDLDSAVDDLANTARSLERFLSIMPDADTAMRSVPHQPDHYAYSDAARSKLIELQEAF